MDRARGGVDGEGEVGGFFGTTDAMESSWGVGIASPSEEATGVECAVGGEATAHDSCGESWER